jgi:hypothetical protein
MKKKKLFCNNLIYVISSSLFFSCLPKVSYPPTTKSYAILYDIILFISITHSKVVFFFFFYLDHLKKSLTFFLLFFFFFFFFFINIFKSIMEVIEKYFSMQFFPVPIIESMIQKICPLTYHQENNIAKFVFSALFCILV